MESVSINRVALPGDRPVRDALLQLEGSGNPIAVQLFGNAQLRAMTFAWDLGHGNPAWFAEIVERTAATHRAVFDAIRARDPAAARKKMLGHVSWAQLEIPEHEAAMREAAPARSR